MPGRRILVVEQNEDGTVGGSHQALYDLATRLDRSSWEPVVAFYEDNIFVERLRAAGVETHVLDRLRSRERAIRRNRVRVIRLTDVLPAVLRRARLLRSLKIDAVHLINSPSVGFDDWLPAARIAGVPIVTSAMGVMESRPWGPLQRWLQRRYDRVLPVSAYICQAWLERGVPLNALVTIHHGIDVDGLRRCVRRSREEVREELGVGPDVLLVLMVGNIRPWKGQHVLVGALRAMDPSSRSRVRAVFVGAVNSASADYAKALSDEVAAHDLAEQVTFLGPRRDVPDLIHSADIVVHASVHPEPGGLIVMESMALGAPVIASERGGHTEVLTSGTGLLFDPDRPIDLAAALKRLIENPEERRRLSEAAGVRIEQFGIDRCVRETETVYAQILGQWNRTDKEEEAHELAGVSR